MKKKNVILRGLSLRRVETALGTLTLVASETELVGVYFPNHQPAPRLDGISEGSASELLDRAARELTAYVSGEPYDTLNRCPTSRRRSSRFSRW